jgi:hypothetical protein
MTPVVKHLPLHNALIQDGFNQSRLANNETASGVDNVSKVLTFVSPAAVRLHRDMCWYVIVASVLTVLSIVLFCGGCNHAYAGDDLADPVPIDYGIYPADPQPQSFRVPTGPGTNAVAAPEPASWEYGLAGLALISVALWLRHRLNSEK